MQSKNRTGSHLLSPRSQSQTVGMKDHAIPQSPDIKKNEVQAQGYNKPPAILGPVPAPQDL